MISSTTPEQEALSPLFDWAGRGTSTHRACQVYGRTRFVVPRRAKTANQGLDVFLQRHTRSALNCQQWWLRLTRRDRQRGLDESALLIELKAVLGVQGTWSVLSVGTPGPHQKNTLVFVAENGTIGPVVKVATKPASIALLKNELQWLQRLGADARFVPNVPAVLSAGDWQGMFILAQSCRTGRRSSLGTSVALHDFLVRLQGLDGSRQGFIGSRMHQTLRTRQRLLTPRLPESIAARIDGVMKFLETRLDERTSMVAVHGDFAPWNVRICGGVPWIFDWEYATEGYIAEYDYLHYRLHRLAKDATWSASRLRQAVAATRAVARTVFRPHPEQSAAASMAYLLDAAMSHLERSSTDGVIAPVVQNYVNLIDAIRPAGMARG